MLQVNNDNPKCDGQDSTENNVCHFRNKCGRYLRPEGEFQVNKPFWRQGADCIEYEVVPREYHIDEEIEEPARVGWDESCQK
jgi:hypothetical protein